MNSRKAIFTKGRVMIKDGIFYLSKKPFFLISAEYPYYRDEPSNWDDRLKKIKRANIDVVTFYIPWRHHMIKQGNQFLVDFEGRTKPNRNLKLFIELCRKNKLLIIVKPGPFVHAELDFGGLPDWVSPKYNPKIEPLLNNKNEPNGWHPNIILPSPLDEDFRNEVNKWFNLVDTEIIRKNVYPKGNIIAIQICNEGVYSNAPFPIISYDYSTTSLLHFRRFVNDKNIDAPKRLNRIRKKSDLRKYLLWSKWQSEYMGLVYKRFGVNLKNDIPFVLNINPPAARGGLDHWLTRIIPENWSNVHYGTTNWLAPVSEDEISFFRYCLTVKRKRGPNVEENWGFSKLYDRRFKYPVICVFQTLLAIANGATGFNIYTAVNTASWDNAIDTKHKRPYPDSAPIKEDGSMNKKYEVLRLLTEFFKENGVDLLESESNTKIAWGFYPPYAYLAAWDIPKRDWKRIGVSGIKCGYEGIDKFHNVLRNKNIDYRILNLEYASFEELKQFKSIILHGGFFMDRKTQAKLSRYVDSGGRVFFIETVPSYDENFKKFTLLKNKVVALNKAEDILSIISDFDDGLEAMDAKTQAWTYENLKKDIRFLFIFNLSDRSGMKEVSCSGKQIKINLAAKSCAVIKLKDSKLDAVFIKGVNELRKTCVVPKVFFDEEKVEAKAPCDLLALRRKNRWQIRTVAY